jgi:hypothetical protein
VQPGDLLLASYGYWHVANAIAPAGWTIVNSQASMASGVVTVWSKIATASDSPGTQYLWSFSGGTPFESGELVAYRGISGITILGQPNGQATLAGNGNTPTLGGIATASSNNLYVGFFCTENTGFSLNGDLNQRALQQYVNGAYFGTMAADKVIPSAGATGTDVSAMNSSGWETVVIGLSSP